MQAEWHDILFRDTKTFAEITQVLVKFCFLT